MRFIKNFIFLLLILSWSCSQDDREPEFSILGYWNLSGVQDQKVFNSQEVPEFQERYIFNDDGTFIKFSTRMGGDLMRGELPIQSFGKYVFTNTSEISSQGLFQLELIYETNPQIAGSCLPDTELLMFDNSRHLKNLAWAACDGPVLVYTRK